MRHSVKTIAFRRTSRKDPLGMDFGSLLGPIFDQLGANSRKKGVKQKRRNKTVRKKSREGSQGFASVGGAYTIPPVGAQGT